MPIEKKYDVVVKINHYSGSILRLDDGYYQEEEYLAAIHELEKRNLATPDIEEEEGVVEKRKSFQEILEALIPTKDYYFTPIIIYINIFIYVLMVFRGINPFEPSVESLISWGGNLRELTLVGQQWRLLSSIFLHGGIFHLLLNMYALLFIGKEIETQFGNNRYLFTYIVTGIFASIASVSINYNIVSVGASGAIFGMYGLLISLLFSGVIVIPKETRKSFITSVLSFVGYNLLYGLTKEGIDNAAHIGGLVSGLILGGLYYLANNNSRIVKVISIGISLLLVAIILISPKVIPNKFGEFQTVMNQFGANEEQALWMYREDLSYIPEEKVQFYYDKFRNEGIDLWAENIELLNSLSDLPPDLEEHVIILKEYSNLRKESCEVMQYLIRYNKLSDQQKLEDINLQIEKLINDLEKLNQ
jgi:rhomboid protease GluP